MRIMPVSFNLDRTKFTSQDNDMRKMIFDSLNEKMSETFSSGDEFIPSAPTQPIIIDKLEIKTGESKNNTATTLAGGGIGGAGSVGISKLGNKKEHKESTQPTEEQKVDYNKIADEAAQETNTDDVEKSHSDIDEEIPEEYIDDDSDYDYDEE